MPVIRDPVQNIQIMSRYSIKLSIESMLGKLVENNAAFVPAHPSAIDSTGWKVVVRSCHRYVL